MDVAGVIAVALAADRAERLHPHQVGKADHRVERRPQLVGHAGEKLRLVLARRLQLTCLLLDLAEQPRVLDRDNRLGREGLEELDVHVGEPIDVVVGEADPADHLVPAKHRDGQHAPGASGSHVRDNLRTEDGIGRAVEVADPHGTPRGDRATDDVG